MLVEPPKDTPPYPTGGRRPGALGPAVLHLVCVMLAGCSPAAIRVSGPVPAGDLIGVQALANKLGLQLRRSNGCVASMADPANTLVIIGPPQGAAILNGRRYGRWTDTAVVDGQLKVSPHLAATLRHNLRRRSDRSPNAARDERRNWPVVVLDAGHGGKDPGASRSYAPAEKHLALDTAIRVRNLLRKKNITVFMTRCSDRFVPLDDRARFANERRADLFVSIHADSAPNPKARGFTVYIARKAGGRTRRLAQYLIAATKRRALACRGMKRADFRVLVRTKMPAALVELGYLTHRAEAVQLSTPTYRQRLAETIAEGICGYLAARR